MAYSSWKPGPTGGKKSVSVFISNYELFIIFRCSQCSESFRLEKELQQHISQHYISAQLEHTSTDIIDDSSKDLIIKPNNLQTTMKDKININVEN